MRLERARRLPWVPPWAVAVVALWLALVGLYEWLDTDPSPATGLCLFRRVTGIPCPTCGTTRAVKSAFVGDPIEAFLSNPFVVMGAILLAVVLAGRVAFARVPVLAPVERRVALIIAAAGLAANWVYLIMIDRG